jgi:GTP-binding protein EngB required for normal cell division
MQEQVNSDRRDERFSKKEALQTWADIDAHLQFADQIIQKADFPESLRAEIGKRLTRILHRREDPNMYLAVIGEFSTGKSTFINALLREELLKTSVDVTTTTATRLYYGPQVDLEVQFQKSSKTLSYLKEHTKLQREIEKAGQYVKDSLADIHACINAVTADNSIVSRVRRITIRHPASFLMNGTVIIDTPGVNSEHNQHAQITRDIVNQEADAAVIIIPAPVPLAASMSEFLVEQLKPFIHRCLFVVTQMDKIPEREQKRLLENIRTRLRKVIGNEHPITLYATAPQIVLDMRRDRNSVAPALQQWDRRFVEFEHAIWERLQQERVLSMTESILRLLTKLFEELNGRLRERWLGYETRQEAIRQETIQDISAFAEEQRQAYQRAVTQAVVNARSRITGAVAWQRGETEEGVRKTIFETESVSELKTYGPDRIKTHMNNAGHYIQSVLYEQASKIEKVAVEASQAFDQRFSQEYSRLQALAGTIAITSGGITGYGLQASTSSVFTSVDKIHEEFDGTTNTLGWGGAALGAGIGTMILPGIGTIAGLLVGPILIGLFGPSLQDRQTKVWEATQPALISSFNTMETQAYADLNSHESGLYAAFDQRLNSYMQRYKAVVDKIIHQQQRELAQIKLLQSSIQADQKEIERRQEFLTQKQQHVSKLSSL